MTKRYMIRSDMEGVSGIVSYAQAEPGGAEYSLGLELFKADLCACLDGLFAGGADEVVIYDEHYYGRNIDPAWLPNRTSVICGKPPYRADWPGGLDETFAGMIMLGLHAKFGTPNGLLHHSYEHDIRDMQLNGTAIGEIGMETAIAGDVGVPLVLMTGDSAGCAEAEALVEGVRTVAVKESLGETGARCYPLRQTSQWIYDAAQAVAEGETVTTPWQCGPDVSLTLAFNPGPYADQLRQLYRDDIDAAGSLTLHGPRATAVWADYWQRKLRVQAQLLENT